MMTTVLSGTSTTTRGIEKEFNLSEMLGDTPLEAYQFSIKRICTNGKVVGQCQCNVRLGKSCANHLETGITLNSDIVRDDKRQRRTVIPLVCFLVMQYGEESIIVKSHS